MTSPEFPINVSLPEKVPLLRESAGRGVDVIDAETTKYLLATSQINRVIDGFAFLYLDPDLRTQISEGKLFNIPLNATEDSNTFNPTTRASNYTLSYAENIKKAGVGAMLEGTGSKKQAQEEVILVFHDIGTGIALIPQIVKAIEGIKSYDKIEGVNDPRVKKVLEDYEAYPLKVINDAVAAHVARYDRNSPSLDSDVGIYVPECLAYGAKRGLALFKILYDEFKS